MDDQKLTDHFTLYELTRTSVIALQAENRVLNDVQIRKLKQLAELLEVVRDILETPIIIASGYRCSTLNWKVGGAERSQHMRSEAADFIPKGIPVDQAFSTLRKAVKTSKVPFGQLIYEKQIRPYGTEWIHISLGKPYRDPSVCGEILSMNDGKYHLIETVKDA